MLNVRSYAQTFVIAASALIGLPVSAAEYYVATNGVDAVGRGSEDSPFETIQYAINSASAGSTIWVKPGIYDKGGAENSSSSGTHSNRVVLTKKIYLKSTDGASVTHIVGAPDPDTGGVGPNAVRCIVSPNNTSADSTISGFTLRDGYGDDGTANHRSGGFLQYNGNKWILISDCVISNCTAFSHGGARGGTFSRCLFVNNKVTKAYGETGTAVGSANLVHCIITGNGINDADCAVDSSTLVNCTVVCNRGYGVRHNTSKVPTGCKLFNTVVCGNLNADGTVAAFVNCAIGGYPIVSPLDEDYRVVSGRAADATGDVSHLNNLADSTVFGNWVPESLKKYDFYGSEIDLTSDRIHLGAVQAVATVEGGAVYMRGPLSCGTYSSSSALPVYAQSTNILTQWRVKYAEKNAAGKYIRYVHSRLNGAVTQRSLSYENELIVMVPMKSGTAITNNPEFSKAFWVDPKIGSDKENDGSEASPFATIQKAVDMGGAETVVLLAPGLYDAGGMSSDDPAASTYGRSRVWITNSHVRIVGRCGAEKTIIAGAPDPVTRGFGDGAIRCLLSTNSIVNVQGVTISNGWTFAEMTTFETTNHLKGCAARNVALSDCIITCCHGCSSIFSNSSINRCKVYANEARENSLFSDNGRIVCSWIGPNSSKSSTYFGYVGSQVNAWFSTLIVTNGQSAFSQNAQLYNCIAVGGKYVRKDMKSKGCLFWDFEEIQSGADGEFANPRFASDKLHVKSVSPALTVGVAPSVAGYAANDTISKTWSIVCSADIDGGFLRFNVDGSAMAGAAHEPVPYIPVGFRFIAR